LQGGVIMIVNSFLDPSISSVIKENHIKQKDVEKNLDLIFPHLFSGFASTMQSFNQIEEPKL
jgi:hypothetical protein